MGGRLADFVVEVSGKILTGAGKGVCGECGPRRHAEQILRGVECATDVWDPEDNQWSAALECE